MTEYKIPGVYIEEIPRLPPSISSVETAIPAFIGFTEKAQLQGPGDLLNIPTRIGSMLEFEQYFGGPQPEVSIQVSIDVTAAPNVKAKLLSPRKYALYYQLQLFFLNGGGNCYIVSVGDYSSGDIDMAKLQRGLAELEKVNEITLILFPDAHNMDSAASYYALHKEAMDQAARLKDRFVVMDIWVDPADADFDPVATFRNTDFGDTGTRKYAAIYYPRIYTPVDYAYDQSGATVSIICKNDSTLDGTLEELKSKNINYYHQAKAAIANMEMLLPASVAVVGKYAQTDNSRGVWKSPASITIDYALRPELVISHKEQANFNADADDGKSINVIRSFPGRGAAIIWGARTLAGNDNEWRYISVCRFFMMVAESTKNATGQFVFEPNDRNTWIRVRSMIENYLTLQWKAGALRGSTTREAFYVRVGLGETMTEADIWGGRMIVEIGLAVVRPAEFVTLRYTHKMLQES